MAIPPELISELKTISIKISAVVLQKLAGNPKISYENAGDSEWPKRSSKQRTKLDSHISRFQNLIQKATPIKTVLTGIWTD